MSRSRRLHTTPGSFDFPPASTRSITEPANNRDQESIDDSGSPITTALSPGARIYFGESDHVSHLELPHGNSEGFSRITTTNQTARSTSPETRSRMQRVLRQVHEMQDNADAIRDIQRVLDAQQENQTMMRDIHRRVHELRSTQDARSTQSVDPQRLQDAERAILATHQPISNGPQRMEDPDGPQMPSWSSNSTNDDNAHVHSNNFGMPARRALHNASERLRQVNQELRHLLDRPLEGSPGEIQRLSDAHDNLQLYLDRALDESPDQLQYLLQLDRAQGHSTSRRNFNDLPHIRREVGLERHSGESPPIGPAESDLQQIFDDAMVDVRIRQDTDISTPRSVLLQDSLRQEAVPQPAPGISQPLRNHEHPLHAFDASDSLNRPLGNSNPQIPDEYYEAWRGSGDHRRNMDSSFFPVSSQRSTQNDGDTEQPRHKRRRLNDENVSEPLTVIQYGYEGQVVSGKLKLEIVSCDGTHDSRSFPPRHDTADFVLKDDGSVYYTQGQRCNMVLQHQHQTTFCLERLVIKMPEIPHGAPGQEGLAFVSMRNDEIFLRTTRYQIYYFPTSRFASYFPPTADASNNPETDNRSLVQRPRLQSSSERSQDGQNDPLRADAQTTHIVQPEDLSADDSDDASDGSGGERVRVRALPELSRRHGRATRAAPPSRTRTLNIQAQRVFDNAMARGAAARQRRHRRQIQASSSQTAANSNASNPPLDFLAPVARFVMQPDRRNGADGDEDTDDLRSADGDSTAVTIKFDPPLSGKFILLKMWSPRHGGNVNLQSVMAYGFAGPRWFPSEEMR